MTRGLKLFIWLSVALNLLLIGVTIGHYGHHMRFFTKSPPHMAWIAELPAEKQSLIKEKFTNLREKNKALRSEIRVSRENTLKAFTAEPFNPEIYQQHITQMQQLRNQMKQNMAGFMQEIAIELTADERQIIANKMVKHFKRKDKFYKH